MTGKHCHSTDTNGSIGTLKEGGDQMPYADPEEQAAYIKGYQSKENLWRPLVFKRDFTDKHIHALRIQSEINQVTISEQIANYIKAGLRSDGRLKE